jgi:copper(I)-binding protein
MQFPVDTIRNAVLECAYDARWFPIRAVPVLSMDRPLTQHRSLRAALLGAGLAAVTFLFACNSSGPPKIAIEGQYAELSPMLYGVASVFMTIRNDGGKDAVTGVTVDIPGAITELHDVEGRRMVKVRSIAVPSRGNEKLTPGGPHIMIFNMPRSMHTGSKAVLTLIFERAGERKVPVRFEMPPEEPSTGGR